MLGGALARPAKHRSAFCHRGAAFAVTTIGALVPPIAELVAPHAVAVMSALAPWSTGGQLPNFAAAAGPERYDPAGVLRVGQVARYPM